MENQFLYLGIVGGSYASCAVCADCEADTLRVTTSVKSICLHRYSRGTSADYLGNLCEDIAKEYGMSFGEFQKNLKSCCFSVAGINTEGDSLEAKRLLLSAGWTPNMLDRFTIVDYSFAALLGGTSLRKGLVVVSNIGSAAYIHSGDFPLRSCDGRKAGGWGPIIGDSGSAFEIGAACLRHVARHWESRACDGCEACEYILKSTQSLSFQDLLEWYDLIWDSTFLADWRLEIAQIGLEFLRFAKHENSEQMNKLLSELLGKCVEDIVECVKNLLGGFRELNETPGSPFPIILEGVVFDMSPWFANRFATMVCESSRHPLEVRTPEYRPPVGAWFYSRMKDEGEEALIGEELFKKLSRQIDLLPDQKRCLLRHRNPGHVLAKSRKTNEMEKNE
jgi:N-acetylglucosamine kinase-like BadF-type ATPase